MDPIMLLLLILGLLILVLAVTGRLGEAQNIIVTILLFVALILILRAAGLI